MFSWINITEYPYNRKSERQAQYIPNTDLYASRKSYQTAQHLGFTLTLRNSHRNNQVLNLSSAPGYGITFNKTDFTVGCIVTCIVNPVIKKLVSNSNIFISFTLKKNVIPIFHLENIDWFEDTLYGKSTSHLLQISVFQPCINEECETIVLDLENA